MALEFETFKTLSLEELRAIYGGQRLRLIYQARPNKRARKSQTN
ncbi:bacteriocin [Helicobacter suis]|nr:bacteriocin [Helicobacter suis]